LVVLAMVVNSEGFPKYTQILEGNTSDSSSLPAMIDKLRLKTSDLSAKAIVVIDAGIATEENLKLIQEKAYDYVCVSCTKIKAYTIKEREILHQIKTQNKEVSTLQIVHSTGQTDYILRVKSPDKKLKADAMRNQLELRFEEEIEKIKSSLTKKDIRDAIFAIGKQVDWIALSFVRTSDDLQELQDLIAKHSDHKIPIIAKIEKPEGIENIDKIVAFCDGIMVARGDLGVEVPAHEVPLIQKKLIHRAKTARIPVIVATQMMETMITSLTPTRAEVNDVANSVMDGADAVMLSGETSVGNYPVQVIEKMTQIIEAVEDSPLIQVPQNTPQIRTKRFITKSICRHAAIMANAIKAKAICTLTNSGYTAFQISAWRPTAHILVFTSNKRILTQLNLLWGVKSFYYDKFVSTDDTVTDVNQIAQDKGFVEKGDFLINLAAMPVTDKGMVNTLRVSEIE